MQPFNTKDKNNNSIGRYDRKNLIRVISLTFNCKGENMAKKKSHYYATTVFT